MLKPQSDVCDKRGPGVLSLLPSPLQRPAESIGAIAIVCCAGVLPPTGSGGLRKPQRSTKRVCWDGISHRYRQHGGDSDNRRHVDSSTGRGGMFAISAKLCGQIQLVAGECNVLFLVKLKYVQCLAEFSFRHNVARVCQFHPTFQKMQIRWNEDSNFL